MSIITAPAYINKAKEQEAFLPRDKEGMRELVAEIDSQAVLTEITIVEHSLWGKSCIND